MENIRFTSGLSGTSQKRNQGPNVSTRINQQMDMNVSVHICFKTLCWLPWIVYVLMQAHRVAATEGQASLL